jgi:RIO kinase 1
MLCAGVIHGDLSDFNVLMSHEGPVVIDFPQAVDPTQNPNAKKLLLRDVENLNRFLARFAPDQPARRYGEEIWSLFEKNRLQPDTKLSGRFVGPIGKANTQEVMALIEDADRERRLRGGERDSDELEEFGTPAPFRTVVDFSRESAPRRSAKKSGGKIQRRRPAVGRRASASNEPVPPSGPAADRAGKGDEGPQKSGRRRRTGKSIPDSARRTSKRAPRSGTPTADAAEPAGSKPRRRSRRGRARGGASADRTQAAGKTGTEATGKVSSERRPGRRAESPRSSGKARASSTRAGTDRPPRARRSRRRKASSPK